MQLQSLQLLPGHLCPSCSSKNMQLLHSHCPMVTEMLSSKPEGGVSHDNQKHWWWVWKPLELSSWPKTFCCHWPRQWWFLYDRCIPCRKVDQPVSWILLWCGQQNKRRPAQSAGPKDHLVQESAGWGFLHISCLERHRKDYEEGTSLIHNVGKICRVGAWFWHHVE